MRYSIISAFMLSMATAVLAQTNLWQDSGYVGIGTTSPETALDVSGLVTGRQAFVIAGGGPGGNYPAGNFWNLFQNSSGSLDLGRNGWNPILRIERSGNVVRFNTTGGLKDFVLTGSGNVGLGTQAPATRLELSKFVSASEPLGSVNNPAFRISNTNSAAYGEKAELQFAVGGGVTVTSAITASYSQWVSPGGMNIGSDLIFSTKPAAGNLTERVRIDKNGYVGIGTTVPSVPLDVVGTVRATERFNVTNPNNQQASVQLDWFNDVARIRVGGNGLGSNGGLVIQTIGDVSLLRVLNNGNVGIGTTSPTHKLTVNGTIRAKEVIVDTGWADYVFAEDYHLAPLSEVEAHIKAHRHLPDMPSAAEVAENGVSMGEMQARMMAKIEELTLHVIRLEKQNRKLEQELIELRDGR